VQVTELEIPGLKLIVPKRFEDARGFLSEIYSVRAFKDAGIEDVFVQDNFSLSIKPGTVRGLHFQRHAFAQAKIVRVSRGHIFDVAVDLRPASPAYGRHVVVELSHENQNQLYIPAGFAHGFCTLEANSEVVYKVSSAYAPQAEAGVLWNDPALGIKWPVKAEDAVISEKDARLPLLKDLAPAF
jgi:dTDP-4-dehydrorhamnose 3,5-epimerase